ncbi:hypothetical protein BGZ74_010213 [Mortierella antarctica]|nr:hypothetical protein BGZ74_010213 [Mortierella antarctica]
MAGTLFFSVPGLDEDHVGGAGRNDLSDDDEPLDNSDAIPLQQSYLPDYGTDNDDDDHDDRDDTASESSSRSPPMSLFLDRQLQPEVPLTPAAIYLDVPPPVSGKSRGNGSLGEQLLAPRHISGPLGRTSISYKRQCKDPFFAGLYIFAMSVFFIMGIVLLFVTSSSPLDGHIYHIYYVIKSSAASFHGPERQGERDPQDTGLTYLSFLPLGVGTLFLGVIYFRRKYISRTTAIIELASDVLKENPDMFVVSFGLAVIHIVFTAIWLVLFARVFLIGHVESTDVWILEGNFYPIAAYFIFIFMWTSAVLSNVQRVTLANVVSKWYFHRHEPVTYQSSMNTMPALMNALTGSFGSVCLGALFIATVQFAVVLLRSTARKLKGHSFPLLVFVASCCRFIQGMLEHFNNYTLIYVGITGESLFSAARSASKVFRRTLLWGIIADFLTKQILFVNSLLLSLLTGFSAYVFATHTLQSPYGYVIGILSAIIPFYITRFFTHIMAITVDTTFLCYAIDLDTNTCHSNKAHSAFGTAYD